MKGGQGARWDTGWGQIHGERGPKREAGPEAGLEDLWTHSEWDRGFLEGTKQGRGSNLVCF
jgi:hypothetical protein